MRRVVLHARQCPPLRFEARVAEGFTERLIGLLSTRRAPAPGTGLLLRPGGSVHGLGMKEAVDALFLDADNRVIGHRRLRPWRWAIAPAGTAATLEIAPDQIPDGIIGCYFMEERL